MAQKKTFNLQNPALQFISAQTEQEEQPQQNRAAKVPQGYKQNPVYIEKKTRRLQLLMQPSLYNKLKKRAQNNGCSVNDTLHVILAEALKSD